MRELKALFDHIEVPAFHHEQHIGPVDHFLIYADTCLIARAGRAGLMNRMMLEQ